MGVSGGVIPQRGDEGAAANRVVVDRLDLVKVFVEGVDWVGGWGKRQIIDLERAIGYGGDKERVVVDAIDGVEEGEFYERGGRSGSKVEDVDVAGFFWVVAHIRLGLSECGG